MTETGEASGHVHALHPVAGTSPLTTLTILIDNSLQLY
jgi:hypothetical protein